MTDGWTEVRTALRKYRKAIRKHGDVRVATYVLAGEVEQIIEKFEQQERA
jgi:hypothetical protein